MKFNETKIKDAYIVELEKHEDIRGFFAREWDTLEFKSKGINQQLVQISISSNKKKGTIRGIHYQLKPHQEMKYVRCIRGKVFEVLIDLRPDSETFKEWFSVELRSNNYKAIISPEGTALAYQTLEDDTELLYHMSEFFSTESYRGIRYDDPTLNINWPLPLTVIKDRDLTFPYLDEAINEIIENKNQFNQ